MMMIYQILFAMGCVLPFNLISLSVSELSLEEKIGQILMIHIGGEDVCEDSENLIRENYIGGIIYYTWANGLKNPHQVQNLSRNLQICASKTPHKIPLLIAVDQEGGVVNRLKRGFTNFPGNFSLGQTKEWLWGAVSARSMGNELRAVGILLNLGPVIDVSTEEKNPVIGIRAFDRDPACVATWASYFLSGYRKAGIIAALKHFPGHGDVQVDSHEVLPIVRKNREELERDELVPYRVLIPEAEVIMTSHLLFPALDNTCCVTFSRKIIQDLLRDELNFQGIIMTDSLAMEGILSQASSIEEAVVKSIEAGHDLILLGGKQLLPSQRGKEFTSTEIRKVHQFLVMAFQEKRLSEKMLDKSVARILALKEKYRDALLDSLEPSLIDEHINTISSRILAQKIAEKALKTIRGAHLLPLDPPTKQESFCLIIPERLREYLLETSWKEMGEEVKVIYFNDLNFSQQDISVVMEEVVKVKKCIYFSYDHWRHPAQKELLQQIEDKAFFSVGIIVSHPLDLQFLNASNVLICTHSPVSSSLQAAYDRLFHLSNKH